MTWEQMQRGELEWWRAFLARPHALERLFALYGYRYLDFFFKEFNDLGNVIDFGSGPVSAAWIADRPPEEVTCIDPLFTAYRKVGLVYGRAREPAGTIPAEFDTALVLNVLDHADDPVPILITVAGTLKPGGKALVWVHVEQPADALHRLITAGDVRGWLKLVGLTITRSNIRRGLGPAQFMAVAERQ